MKQLRLVFTILSLAISTIVFAQNSSVKGTIFSMENGTKGVMPFVNIAVQGTTIGTTTDFDGNFTIVLKEGEYNLIMSFIGYRTEVIKVKVSTDQPTTITQELKLDESVLEVVEIVAEVNKESKTTEITEVKNSKSVDNVISFESMSEKNVSNASDATKKVVGLSVVGSKYVFVRGMGDRYNSAYLNGMPIPSPDPDNKVIPLNIFPSSILQSIAVKKAFTTDLYADFSGGAINIRTKNAPSKPTLNVTYGTSFNSQATFKDFETYKGGKLDKWGIENGARSMPVDAISSEYYSATSSNTDGQSDGFQHNFNTSTIKAPLNQKFGLIAGNSFSLNKEKEIGVLFLANYSNQYNYQNGTYRIINAQDEQQINYTFDKWNYSTRGSIMGNMNFKLNKNHNIQLTTLFVNMSSDETRETYGYNWDYPDNVFSRRLTYKQNSLFSNQLEGSHLLLSDIVSFKWGAGISSTKSIEPDRRQLIFWYDNLEATDDYIMNDLDVNDNHRFFSELNELEYCIKGDVNIILKQDKEEETKRTKSSINIGYNRKTKNRTFDYRQFNYNVKNIDNHFSSVNVNGPESYLNNNIMDQGGFYIKELGDPASEYKVYQDITAIYSSFNWTPNDQLMILSGIRYEDGYQYLITKNQQTPTITEKYTVDNVSLMNSLLPSIVVKYNVNDTNIVRVSLSKTVSRPGFKEVAPFEYVEMFAGTKSIGNPYLKNANVYNVDLRFEKYPRFGEKVTFGGFYKFIENPIEKTMLATASGQLQSFANANQSIVSGLELEVTKNLNFIGKDSSKLNRVFKHISLNANGAYIYSMVIIDTAIEGASIISTNTRRPLQGSSPFLINFDMTYQKRFSDNFKGTASASYNVFGRRLYAAGAQGIGDSYELPASNLNLVLKGEFNTNLSISLSVGNILNPTYQIVQEGETKDLLVNSYKTGFTSGISITYKILEKRNKKTLKSDFD